MRLICDYCNRDLNKIWQCNMSHEPFKVTCEDCSGYTQRKLNELRDKDELVNRAEKRFKELTNE